MFNTASSASTTLTKGSVNGSVLTVTLAAGLVSGSYTLTAYDNVGTPNSIVASDKVTIANGILSLTPNDSTPSTALSILATFSDTTIKVDTTNTFSSCKLNGNSNTDYALVLGSICN